jgi:hypothetical protein
LNQGAGARNAHSQSRDPVDLVSVESGAGGETPGSICNDAHAEPKFLALVHCGYDAVFGGYRLLKPIHYADVCIGCAEGFSGVQGAMCEVFQGSTPFR